jgi:nicotinic acid mononucleotide adenylyltransferase
MPRWYQIDKLLKQVQLLVVPRPGYEIDEAGVEELRKLGAKLRSLILKHQPFPLQRIVRMETQKF